MTPPILPSHVLMLKAASAKMLFIKTPNIENTIVNPSTKNTVLRNTTSLALDELLASDALTPDIYDKNPGINGSTQGDKKDTMPATNAITKVVSAIFY